jgi:methionine-rich copper-binding protein CopC
MRQATHDRIVAAACAMAASWLAGCAGNGAGLDANGQPLVPGAPGNGPLTADFASIQAQVFTPICTTCHAGADAPHGLRLDAANSYSLLVGVASVEVPSLLRVKPGDPDSSYLIQKLEGIAAVGARMPFGGPYLSSGTIAVIRQWITDGAQPASTGAAPASFTIVSVAPAAGEVLAEAPAQIMIAFNHELDVTRIDPDSVRIERRAGQGIEAPAQRVAARIEVPSANPRALLLWPTQPLGAGRYRVLMRVAAPLGITDIAGESLSAGDSADAVILTFDVEAAP